MRMRRCMTCILTVLSLGLSPVSLMAQVAPQIEQPELIYTPITPCRAFGGIAQTPGQTLNFQITGAADLSGQGGPTKGCGIPASAKAVSINLSASSSSTGKLTGFAKGTTRPNITSLNYQPNKTETAGTTVSIGSDGKISVYTSGASKSFGDVTGYFAPQIAVFLRGDGSVVSATTRILKTEGSGSGQYKITVDRNVESCAVQVTPRGGQSGGVAATQDNFIFTGTWTFVNGTPTWTNMAHMVVVAC
jgi:hypothetical protein